MSESRPSILVLGTADWSQPIATNQHYMVRELADSTPPIDLTFVESQGLRRPQLTSKDLKRIWARLTRRGGGPAARAREVPKGVSIVSPLVLPVHTGALRWVNYPLLRLSVRRWLRSPGPRILWTYTPVTYGLEKHAAATLYHCVDLLGTFPGIDPALILRAERRLAASASAIASSRAVQAHLTSQGFDSPALWENVADTSVFESALSASTARSPRRVVFAGNLSPHKVDFDLLIELSRAGFEVRVAGPNAEGGGNASRELNELTAAGVHYLGMLTLPELAMEFASASVGLIPYVLNDYTRGVSPLKTYEYLAAGLAVVATDLPGVTGDEEDVFIANTVADFIEAVSRAGKPTEAALLRRAAKARRHNWSGRGTQARELIRGLSTTSDSP